MRHITDIMLIHLRQHHITFIRSMFHSAQPFFHNVLKMHRIHDPLYIFRHCHHMKGLMEEGFTLSYFRFVALCQQHFGRIPHFGRCHLPPLHLLLRILYSLRHIDGHHIRRQHRIAVLPFPVDEVHHRYQTTLTKGHSRIVLNLTKDRGIRQTVRNPLRRLFFFQLLCIFRHFRDHRHGTHHIDRLFICFDPAFLFLHSFSVFSGSKIKLLLYRMHLAVFSLYRLDRILQ